MRNRHLWLVAMGFAAGAAPLMGQLRTNFFFGSNVTGQLTLSTTVNVSQVANAGLTPHAVTQFVRSEAIAEAPEATAEVPEVAQLRLGAPTSEKIRRGRNYASQTSLLRSSLIAATTQSASVVPTSSFGFMGITHYDERNAYGGNQFSIEPPSQGLAVGNGFIVEAVNNAFQVYDMSGQPKLPAVLSTNQVFGLGPSINRTTNLRGVYPTDIRAFYDQTLNRFFVLQRSQDNDIFGTPLASSHMYIAVSQTADPTGTYNVYVMNTTNPTHLGCPCIADYPEVGADQYGIYITWDEYRSSLSFLDAVVMGISKASLAADAASPVAYQFILPFSTGYEFAIQPATTPPGSTYFTANGGLEYFVSGSRSAGGNLLALWAMTNTSTLATTSPNPLLAETLVTVEGYSVPGNAVQRPGPTILGNGSLEALDGGDSRVQSVEYINAQLYLTFENLAIDDSNRAVIGGGYVILSPIFRGNALAAPVVRQGYFYLNNNHLLRPALAVNAKGQGAIVFTLVGPDYYPSVAFLPISPASIGSTIQIAGVGAFPEDGFTGYNNFGLSRWGDYSAAVVAADGSIWMATEYIPNAPRTTLANWGTYIVTYNPGN
jgi:hypothetical protein